LKVEARKLAFIKGMNTAFESRSKKTGVHQGNESNI